MGSEMCIRDSAKGGQTGVTPVRVQELKDSEIVILTAMQKERSLDLSYSGPLRKLNPMIGRRYQSRRSAQPFNPTRRHQIPSYFTEIWPHHGFSHPLLPHQGRGITMNELRAHGYWIIGASAAVSRMISKCVTCWKLRGVVQ